MKWGTDGTAGVVKSWNMSDGKVGFYLTPTAVSAVDWPVKRKAVTYDIATMKYHFIAPQRTEMLSYHEEFRIALTADTRTVEKYTNDMYLTYIGNDGSYRLAYNKKVSYLAYEPALNDKWAFVNLQETGRPYKMMYAKVGEWEWTVLGEGYGWYPSLVGDHLSFLDGNADGWICDLSKKPQKLEDCLKFNREGEQAEYMFFDKENENRLVYFSKFDMKIVLAEKEGDTYKRTDLITEFSEESAGKAFSILPRMFRGNVLLYIEVTTDGSRFGGRLCYYRLDKKKSYCMKKMERDETYDDGTIRFPYGYSEFEGKWLLYQKRSSTPLILRDMECYCEEEGVCPLEE
jgi:hypothetical protein